VKNLIFILLFIPLALQAQEKREFSIPEPVKAIVLLGGSVVCEAIADGMYDNGNKGPAHALGAASVGMLLTYAVWNKKENHEPLWAIPAYISFRIALFDPIYNTTRGLPINYVGSTSTWDEMINKINPGDGLIFLRCVILTFGIYFTIQL